MVGPITEPPFSSDPRVSMLRFLTEQNARSRNPSDLRPSHFAPAGRCDHAEDRGSLALVSDEPFVFREELPKLLNLNRKAGLRLGFDLPESAVLKTDSLQIRFVILFVQR
jgi:hypothetical protein